MRSFYIALGLATLLGLSGCATTRGKPALTFTGDPLIDAKNAAEVGPARDKVLWQYRAAATAMRRGAYDDARTLLDEALARIGGIHADSGSARRARSLFSREHKKTFIGEPYERVMAYFYRGILYWKDGEIDNARACFRSAQLEDADTENNTYASDYVLLDYLEGLANVKLGGDGTDEFNRAKAAAKNSNPPPYRKTVNTLVFIEFGNGPTKYQGGSYGEELRFREGRSEAKSVVLRVGTQRFPLVPYDDLSFQATTRGGRVMDHILANKAVFKGSTDTLGDAAIVSSLVLANQRQGEAALAVAGVGVISKIISSATTPDADVRTWDNLPQYLTFAALELPPGTHEILVDFVDGAGRVLETRNARVTRSAGEPDSVLFITNLKV